MAAGPALGYSRLLVYEKVLVSKWPPVGKSSTNEYEIPPDVGSVKFLLIGLKKF